jgi:hypothetical protein
MNQLHSLETKRVYSQFRLKFPMKLRSLGFRCFRILIFAAVFIDRAQLAKAEDRIPTVDELVQKAIAQEQTALKHRAGLEYSFSLTTEHYDVDGRRTNAQTVRGIARARPNVEYATELKQQASESAQNDAGKSQEIKEAQSLRAQLDLEKLASHFIYSIRGAGELDGHSCWILAYEPKTGTSAHSREEKVINALRGQLWIDKQTFSILRCDGKTVEPVPVALIFWVDPLEFRYQSRKLSNGEVVPEYFDVAMTMKAPFFYSRQRQYCTLSDFRPPGGS